MQSIGMRKTIQFFVLIHLVLVVNEVKAATEVANARVQIVPAINISQDTEVDFGTLNNVNGTCAMSVGGDLSGTSGMDCAGTQTPGQFTIGGASGSVVTIAVTQGQLGGVTFNPVIAGSNSRTLEEGSTTVTVIGNVVLQDATDGDKNISYTFTANYE